MALSRIASKELGEKASSCVVSSGDKACGNFLGIWVRVFRYRGFACAGGVELNTYKSCAMQIAFWPDSCLIAHCYEVAQ